MVSKTERMSRDKLASGAGVYIVTKDFSPFGLGISPYRLSRGEEPDGRLPQGGANGSDRLGNFVSREIGFCSVNSSSLPYFSLW